MKRFNDYLRHMSSLQPVDLPSFKQKAGLTKRKMRRFLTSLENNTPKALDKKIAALEEEGLEGSGLS